MSLFSLESTKFLLFRCLGPSFGGAIGLMFTLANSIAVAMYTIGFCESLMDMLYQYIPDFGGIVDGTNRCVKKDF